MNALIDTTIAIDALNGHAQAEAELQRYETTYISLVTWTEVMAGAEDDRDAAELEEVLGWYTVAPFDLTVARRAARLRRERGWKLPDAIIYATAAELGLLLVTRNTKDFPPTDPSIRIPYSFTS